MPDPAIAVSQLGKWFDTLYRPDGLRETLAGRMREKGRRSPARGFWALRDVTFEVPRGEVFGIIGHNGAGKSVLLKILAGITTPTEGTAKIHGRIGALLELGTGFHSELSGRDNIFLNGSFLGMRPWEIEEKLDEIIDFSGIRHAIHEPVKHYSSGMTMRLAFSIAVTLAPEVIFLDEVWAVGDMDFQRRAFERIRRIISDGRTVMIVSHSLDTVASVSTSCLLLEGGRVMDQGDSRTIIRSYLAAAARPAVIPSPPPKEEKQAPAAGEEPAAEKSEEKTDAAPEFRADTPDLTLGTWLWANPAMAPGTGRIRLRQVRLLNAEGGAAEKFFIGEPVTVELLYEQFDAGDAFMFGIGVQDLYGSFILASHCESPASPAGMRRAVVTLPGKVCSMSYRLAIMIGGPENFSHQPDILLTDMIRFHVLPQHYDDRYPLNLSGAIPLDLKWTIEPAEVMMSKTG